MSLQDKINNAKPAYWLTEGIPKWRVRLIIWWARVKARIITRRAESEDTCMMQAWYDEIEKECKEHSGNCEQCPLKCCDDPPEID